MQRRQFLTGGAAAALLVGAGAPARAATRPRVLRLACSNGAASQMGAGAAAFAARVGELSGGRIRVELYLGASAGGELETLQDTAKDGLDAVILSTVGFANRAFAPRLGLFDIPFLFRDAARAWAVLDGPIGQTALTELDPAGLVGLAWCENGLRHLTTTAVAVTRPADLTGLKIRVPQSDVMIAGMKALGADAQPLAFPELYGALASGQFQGQENPVANTLGAGFARVQRYLSLTGHIYSTGMLILGRRAYEALPPEDRSLLRAAAPAATRASREAGDRGEARGIAALREQGMTVLAEIDRAAFEAASIAAQPQFDAQFGKATLDAIRAFGR